MIHLVNHYIRPDAENLMRFLRELAPQHQHVLVWGVRPFGTRGALDEFDKIDYEPKFAVPYSRLYMALHFYPRLAELHLEPDVIHFTEYDHIPLRANYGEYVLGALGDADFLGKRCSDRTGAKGWGQLKHVEAPFLDWLESISIQPDGRTVWGCMGNAPTISWRLFQAFINLPLWRKPYEILYPTVAYHLGYKMKAYSKRAEWYLQAGGRHMTTGTVMGLVEEGKAPFCHPHKILEDRPMIYEAILRKAGRSRKHG